VESDATLGKRRGEGGRVVELLCLRADRLIGHEPDIAGAAPIAVMPPTRDVGFVGELDADSEAIQLDAAGLRQMKDLLMRVVQVSPRVDWLEVAMRRPSDCYRLGPNNVILQSEVPRGRQPNPQR
jgi:hypothetical protein